MTFAVILLLLLAATTSSLAQTATLSAARAAFVSLPNEAKTKVWWFQGETETTHRGITADLEELADKGIGGVVLYDQVHGKADQASQVFSQEWWEMLKFSALEAKRLGLTFEASLSNGYVGGGPWVTPEMAMQRLEVIPSPPIPLHGEMGVDRIKLPELPKDKWCKDVAVIAIPLKYDSETSEIKTVRNVEYSLRGRGKAPVQAMQRPLRADEQEDYDGNFQGYKFEKIGSPGRIECSDDSVNWQFVANLHHNYGGSHWNRVSVAIPTTTAKYFRIVCNDDVPERYRPTDIEFSPYAKTDLWEEKVALRSNYTDKDNTPDYAVNEVISHKNVVDVSDLFVDGKAHLDAISARISDEDIQAIRLLRFYRTTTGGKVKHGRNGMNGLECDKLSRKAAELQYNSYFKRIADTVRACGADIIGLAIDSHEAGSQNWTELFPNHFRNLRGYDLRHWLPAMAGYIIGTREETLQFQQDVRRTVADLVATEYFGTLDSLCRRDGLVCTAQATGNGQSLVSDNIMSKGMVSHPQGEFWAYQRDGAYDIKESSSAAHLYGKPIASAEAYTDFDFSKSLGYLKPVMDHAYAMGIQEFVVCASAYQPWMGDTIPGSTGGGRQYAITRTNTQWPLSKAFWDYQTRCSAVMRMGDAAPRLLVLAGSDAPVKIQTHRLPKIPAMTDFDVATDHAFLNTKRHYPKIALYRDVKLSKAAQQKLDSLKKQGVTLFEDTVFTSKYPFARHHQRHLADADIFFLYNPTDKDWSDMMTFDVPYSKAELWTPVDGRQYSLEGDNINGFNISLRAGESAFIVLSNYPNNNLPKWNLERKTQKTIDKWTATFYPIKGESRTTTLPSVFNWTTSNDAFIKYFSGKAVYNTEVNVKKCASHRYFLHCNSIGTVARVSVNGEKPIGTLWCSPMEIDITESLKNGKNKITLEIVNVVTNRLIGDASLPEQDRQTYSYPEIAKPTDPLVDSGILSPVTITEQP